MKNRRVRGDIAYGAKMFSAVIESSPLAIVSMDAEGHVQLWNPAAETILGYSSSEILGKPHPLMQQQKKDEISSLFHLVLQGNAFSGVTVRRNRKNGDAADLSLAMAPLYDEDNNICGVIQVLSDLTEQKREAEFQRLMEDRMLEAQKMEAVGRMAAGITHDFNNLLTVILGNLDMALADLGATHPSYELLKEIEQASKSAAELTGRMLVFSRRNKSATKTLSLAGLVGELKKILARLLGETIALTITLPRQPCNILADPTQIEQIIMNLVSNAKTAMPNGGSLTIEVAEEHLDENFCKTHPDVFPGPYVKLCLRDTGHGISKNVLKRLFEPFMTTSATGTHAGLGMSIVWAIVKAHHGVIDVESEIDKGTAFFIYFPRIAESGEQASDDVSCAPKGTETILVVDDDSDLLQTLALSLGRLGYKVLQAQGSVEAIKVATQHQGAIHLLFTDVVMPVFSGPDLVARLRRERPSLRAIFSSGYTDHAFLTQCRLFPDAPCISKPYTVQQAAKLLRESLDRTA